METIASLIIGGFIGWLHSWIVIKLVFWPKKPVFVFGRQVPLTPGLFIAGQSRFGREMAHMLRDKFMGPEDVQTALGQVLESGVVQRALRSEIINSQSPVAVIGMTLAVGKLDCLRAEELTALSKQISAGVSASGVVERTVGDKVATMSPDDIEKMIMDVVHHELRAIIWLGFPLGVLVVLAHEAVQHIFSLW